MAKKPYVPTIKDWRGNAKPFGPSPVVGDSGDNHLHIRSYGLRSRKLSDRTHKRVFGDFDRWLREQTRLADEV